MQHKLLVILGPTSSGKSDLAVRLAKRFHGEVVSADSRQVYRGLDLGTGKVTKKEMAGIPHHLLDVASPKRVFTVADYQKQAGRAIRDIHRRGKLPILCGGTGFYIEAVVYGTEFPKVPPNKTLRKELGTRSTEELLSELENHDPHRAATIDPHNRHRLIRALEIVATLGRVPRAEPKAPLFDALQIGIELDVDTLANRIRERLRARMRRGMLAEARRLHNAGVSWKRMEELGLEYRYLAKHLKGEVGKEAMLIELEEEIARYAKRQLTWFKRDKAIVWYAIPQKEKELIRQVTRFLHSDL